MSDRKMTVFCYCIAMVAGIGGISINNQQLQLAGIFWIGCALFHKLPWKQEEDDS